MNRRARENFYLLWLLAVGACAVLAVVTMFYAAVTRAPNAAASDPRQEIAPAQIGTVVTPEAVYTPSSDADPQQSQTGENDQTHADDASPTADDAGQTDTMLNTSEDSETEEAG